MDTLLLEVKLKDHQDRTILKQTREVTLKGAGATAQECAEEFAAIFRSRRSKHEAKAAAANGNS
jgi:hypothetical protein